MGKCIPQGHRPSEVMCPQLGHSTMPWQERWQCQYSDVGQYRCKPGGSSWLGLQERARLPCTSQLQPQLLSSHLKQYLGWAQEDFPSAHIRPSPQ